MHAVQRGRSLLKTILNNPQQRLPAIINLQLKKIPPSIEINKKRREKSDARGIRAPSSSTMAKSKWCYNI
jgi:hypothetical protein